MRCSRPPASADELNRYAARNSLSARVLLNSHWSQVLDDAAVEYAKGLVFKPATRQGRPTSVWITWTVSYNLEPLLSGFEPSDYVQNIMELFGLPEEMTGKERERILDKILKTHDDFVDFLAEDFNVNHNVYIREFVQPEVEEQWRDFWPDWPVGFVVFHDFILRFPDSDQVADASARLLDLIKQDILHIKAEAEMESNI